MDNLRGIVLFLRTLKKQKLVTFMNVAGLGLGVTIALLVGLWVLQEFSYDNFHRNGDRIYRLVTNFTWCGTESFKVIHARPMGEVAKAEIPQIEKMCRVVSIQDEQVSGEHQEVKKRKVVITDETFFDLFTFSLKEGEKSNILASPDNMVIDETTASLLFPGENAIGRVVHYASRDWKVSGVMRDIPVNSHIQANIVVPLFGAWRTYGWQNWEQPAQSYVTYFLLQENTDRAEIGKQLTEIGQNAVPFYKQVGAQYYLEPLKDVHFSKKTDGAVYDKSVIVILAIAAFIVLLFSCINFSSLFISVAFLRARNVGIRKTHGAPRKKLIMDFYKETFVYVLLAMGIAFLLVVLFTPVFNKLLHTNLQLYFSSWQLYLFVGLLCVFTVVLSGTFPAFYITRFNIVQTLSERFKGRKLSLIQKGLLIVQFSVAFACFLSVFFIHKQVNTMLTMDLGFDKENIFYVPAEGKLLSAYNVVREELMKNPSVIEVSMKNALPQDQTASWVFKRSGSEDLDVEDMENYLEVCRIKGNYFDLMKMEFVIGENPFISGLSSPNYCVVNEATVKKLGLNNPVGAHIEAYGQDYVIGGVVKNAYTKALYSGLSQGQVYFSLGNSDNWGYILVKVQGNPQSAIKIMQDLYEDKLSDMDFEYGFLDAAYEALYQKETDMSEMLSWLMLFTLLVSISGLFNMSYYAVGQRIKEISLRKINGASQTDLLILLNWDFVGWVLLAFILASPVAYLFASSWQEGFIIKTPLSWWIFALTGILAVITTLLTVSYQTIKTSRVNPVEVLKNE